LFSIDFSVYLFISLFISLFVSLSARLREHGWTDLHEIFREGVEWESFIKQIIRLKTSA